MVLKHHWNKCMPLDYVEKKKLILKLYISFFFVRPRTSDHPRASGVRTPQYPLNRMKGASGDRSESFDDENFFL
jgi:hypothetical protein